MEQVLPGLIDPCRAPLRPKGWIVPDLGQHFSGVSGEGLILLEKLPAIRKPRQLPILLG